MSLAKNIEELSTKIIKPFVPTPPSLRHYKLSFIDEFAPAVNVGIVLFFSANNDHIPKFVAQLEKSLEKTLTQFYPLAGRYVEETNTIDCSDQGAEFIFAKVNSKLQDFLVFDENVSFIDSFIPSVVGAVHQLNGSLLATKVTTFECGGIALGVSATHKLVDASTLCTFVNEWAVMNRKGYGSKSVKPTFNSSLLFPTRNDTPAFPPLDLDILSKYTRKKFLFSESVICNMKAKRKSSTRQWSKVQLVSAIIWKARIGVDIAVHNKTRESILIQAVNIREKMASLIPKNSCGNLLGFCTTECTALEETDELVDRLSDSVKKMITSFSKAYHDTEEGQTMVLNSLSHTNKITESTNVVIVTSWCKFPFYEADFGFGKPVWAAPGTLPIKDTTYLMDEAEGNGVEAYVYLKVKDVPYFEQALDHVISLTS